MRNDITKGEIMPDQYNGYKVGTFSKFFHPAHVNIINSITKKLLRLGWLNEKHTHSLRSGRSLRINGTCLNMPNYMFFSPLLVGEEITNINHGFQTQYLSSKNNLGVVENYILRLFRTLRIYFCQDYIV